MGQIKDIKIPLKPGPDRLVWKPDPKGQFPVATVWETIRNRSPKVAWNRLELYSLPNIALFCWKVLHRKRKTDDVVKRSSIGILLQPLQSFPC